MRRLFGLVLPVMLLVVAVAFVGCKKEEVFVPECEMDIDCGLDRYCEGGRCLVKRTPEDRAGEHLDRAEALLAEPNIDCRAVLEAYRAALSEVPKIEGVTFNMGLCYLALGQFDQAEGIFNAARTADPDDVQPVLALGRLYTLRGQEDRALQLFLDYSAAHPANLEIHTNIATIYRLRRDFDKAMVHIREILLRDPAHPGAFNNLGLVYMAQGELRLARMVTVNGIEAQQNVKKKPDAGLYNNLALIYMEMGDMDRATANFRNAHRIDQRLVSANLNLGHIALKHRNYASARQHYELVLSQEPGHREATLGLALCLKHSGESAEEALAYYQEILQRNPNDPVALFNMGVLYFDFLKKQDEAHATFERYLSLNHPDATRKQMAQDYLIMEIWDEPEPVQRRQRDDESEGYDEDDEGYGYGEDGYGDDGHGEEGEPESGEPGDAEEADEAEEAPQPVSEEPEAVEEPVAEETPEPVSEEPEAADEPVAEEAPAEEPEDDELPMAEAGE